MLSTWLSNSSTKRLKSLHVDIDSKKFCKAYDIFLVGMTERMQDCPITSSLSTFNLDFDQINFLDLGFLKNNDLTHLQGLLDELRDEDVHVLVLNSNQNLSYSKNSTLISRAPNFDDVPIDDLRFVGYQRHYLSKNIFLKKDPLNKSLGEINKNMAVIEPILRSSSSLIFELSAIKSTEFSEFGNNFSPVGLSILQSCQIARYSGFSKSLKTIHFTDFSYSSMAQCHTIALWIWYYMEGRDLDLQANTNKPDTTSYIVNSSTLDLELEFIKENQSERWWLRSPSNQEIHIPCMYEDYLAVINEDAEEKILELLKTAGNSL